MGEREAQVLGEELPDVGALDILGLLDFDDAENVNRPEASAVPGSHVRVESLNSISAGHLAVLLVHVVRARAGVVSKPDAEVLDLLGVLLVDSLDADNLASGLLDLSESAQEVPESGLGDRLVRSEDGHAVHVRRRVGLSGQMAPNDIVFLKTTFEMSLISAVTLYHDVSNYSQCPRSRSTERVGSPEGPRL